MATHGQPERSGSSKQSIVSDNWKCDVCSTSFTGGTYYETHLGTRKHKRNLRAARRAASETGFAGLVDHAQGHSLTGGCLNLSDLSDICDYKGVRENYRQKNLKYFEEYYTSYVSAVVAYWAVNLALNPTVRDFKITVNDRDWHDFGDATVEIHFKDLPGKKSSGAKCAIQFKHIVSNNVKTIDSFAEGKFGYEAIASQIAKRIADWELEGTRFLVFTTSIASAQLATAITVRCCQSCRQLGCFCKCALTDEESVCVQAKSLSNRRNLILNTSEDNETIYRFFPKVNSYTVPKINIYSCQKKLRDFPRAIDETIFTCFGSVGIPSLARDLIKFVENWSNGKCGGYFKLKKEEVLVRLGFMLLNPYRVTPKVKTLKAPTFANNLPIWIHALKCADVTIIGPSGDLSRILEPFNLMIKKQLKLPLDSTNDDCVRIVRTKERDDPKHLENAILRTYLIEETARDCENRVTFDRLHGLFWKAGLMPLIMHVDAQEREIAFKIVGTLKNLGLVRRYLVRTPLETHPSPSPCKLFVNLNDVSAMLGPNLLGKVHVQVDDHFSLSLNDIDRTDPLFKKTISAEEFFLMTLGGYHFRPCPQNAGDDDALVSKLVVSADVMGKLRQEMEARISREPSRQMMFKAKTNRWLRDVNPLLFK